MRTNSLLYALIALVVFNGWSFVRDANRTLAGHSDFAERYVAGKIVADGSASSLYDHAVEKRVQLASFGRELNLASNHPPFEVLLYWPLAHLPYPWAYCFWAAGCVAALVVLPRVLRPHVPALRRAVPYFVALSSVAFFPACYAVIQGQDSIFLTLLFALAFVSLKRGHDLAAGCLLAAALFKFQFVLPIAALFLLRRRWKLVGGFSAAGVVLVVLSLLLVGVNGLMHYPALLIEQNRGLHSGALQGLTGIFPCDMPNLRGLLFRALSGFLPESLVNLTIVAASAVLFFWWARRSARLPADSRALDLMFSVDICIAVLVSYHAELHDLTLLLIPILLVLEWSLRGRTARWMQWSVGLLAALFFFTPMYVYAPPGEYPWHWPLVIPLSLLAFAGTWQLRRLALEPTAACGWPAPAIEVEARAS